MNFQESFYIWTSEDRAMWQVMSSLWIVHVFFMVARIAANLGDMQSPLTGAHTPSWKCLLMDCLSWSIPTDFSPNELCSKCPNWTTTLSWKFCHCQLSAICKWLVYVFLQWQYRGTVWLTLVTIVSWLLVLYVPMPNYPYNIHYADRLSWF